MSPAALVTGVSQGVGRLLAIFAREGFKVVAMARSAENLASNATEADVPLASRVRA